VSPGLKYVRLKCSCVLCVCESILLPVLLCSTLFELCAEMTIGDKWNEKGAGVAIVACVPCRTDTRIFPMQCETRDM
jgi:hypothetical protein